MKEDPLKMLQRAYRTYATEFEEILASPRNTFIHIPESWEDRLQCLHGFQAINDTKDTVEIEIRFNRDSFRSFKMKVKA